MTTWRDLLRQGQDKLELEDAQREISLFIRHITGSELVDWNENVSETQRSQFQAFVEDRAKGRPLSKIISQRAFWKEKFIISDDVLDPRPDSELLVEAALRLPNISTILELGVGSGAVLLSILAERPKAIGTGADNSPQAIEIAKENYQALKLSNKINWIESDWFSNVKGTFDIIICNPPYLSSAEYDARPQELDWDPKNALTDNADGLSAYRQIAKSVSEYLNEDGIVLLEIGWQQANDVTSIFEAEGFSEIEVLKDINDKDRVVRIEQRSQ